MNSCAYWKNKEKENEPVQESKQFSELELSSSVFAVHCSGKALQTWLLPGLFCTPELQSGLCTPWSPTVPVPV